VTILCAEIPCDPSDPIWSSPDVELGPLVLKGLEQAGLPVRCRVLSVEVKRLPAAYPIYRLGYEEHFDRVDRWVDGLDGVLSFGRQGLYAHDNTHHALFMAHGAVESLRDGELDRRAWHDYRRLFVKHVVED
jgi:protoporphyrinogen oxidase